MVFKIKSNITHKFIYMNGSMNVSMTYKGYAEHFCIFLKTFYETKSQYSVFPIAFSFFFWF